VSNPLVLTDGRYEVDLDDFAARLKAENPKVFILCNPHNPVGRVFTREELLAMGQLCLEHGVTVISDEIHADLVYRDHKHLPLPLVSPAFAANTIVCTSGSKTFNLAGLATSNIIIPDPELRAAFDAASARAGSKSFNIFGTVACEAAYRHGEAWLDQLLIYLEANLDHARAHLARHLPQLPAFKTEGTYFLWVDCRALGLAPPALERFLLEKARLWFNQGHIFGREGEGFVRINIACPRPILDEALSRLQEAVAALHLERTKP
jgi:cystathionine beta-lyase